MSNRIAPLPDKYASFPYDGNILTYFEGVFDSVFIVMQPFCFVTKEHQWILNREINVNKQDFIRYAKPISWQEIMNKLNINNYQDLETGIQTFNNALFEHLKNKVIEKQIIHLMNEQNIFSPETNEFAPCFENVIFGAIKKLGYEWLWVSDEFCTERKLYFIDDLIKDSETLAAGAKIFTADYKLLISPAYGLSNLFICSSKAMIEKMREYVDFEGFYCTDKTKVVWNIHYGLNSEK